ncbi:hypothetical protein CP973_29480 [Streptomyces albofaciens JCM 4342]|uniref:hypothetical protein n=1 Tax=Streptomyces albofaciens TaxID=66866 RepID=UPI00123BDF6C|nr:hypothetical protein [Streptomyces albofaciens]KAA6213378.1 hypothetical protein CP973_29480 [Streptomyces albofaciens JCM 4342]
MSSRTTAPVVTLDLRDGPGELAGADGLHRAVRAALDGTPGRTADRFLLVDTADGLARHQRIHEQVLAYGPGHALCVAVGAPPAEPGDGIAVPPAPTPWALNRPSPLRPPAVGVLWVLDPHGGTAADPAPWEDAGALRPLLELLAAPAVFDAVLHAVSELPDGVAVPALRVLEHDLSPTARARVWRQALADLVGQDDPGGRITVADPEAGGVPAALAPLIGTGMPRSVERAEWRRAGGEADERFRACEAALDEAEEAYERQRGAGGLLRGGGGDADLAESLDAAAAELAAYRETVAEILRDGDGVGLPPEQRRRLHEHGIDLPRVPEAARDRIGPGLRGFAQNLLARRLPLRSTAARLGVLADLATPTGSAARLGRLDELCPPDLPRQLAGPRPFEVRGAAYGELAGGCAVAAAAGLWPGPGWALGPLTALAAAGLTTLALARRPGRAGDGHLDGGGRSGALAQLCAGLVGAAIGSTLGHTLAVPAWLGLSVLLVALIALPLLAVRRWTAALDTWWAAGGGPEGREVLHSLDGLLADAVVHDWLLADARLYCADGARAVAGMIRRAADAAEGREPAPAPGRDGGAVQAGARAPSAGLLEDDWFGPSYDRHTEPQPSYDSFETVDPRYDDTAQGWDDWDDWDREPEPGGRDGAGAADPDTAHGTPWQDPLADTVPPPRRTADGPAPAAAATPPDDVPVPWLEREAGDGGPELVATLVGDLADGIAGLLDPYWGAIERDPGAATTLPVDREVRALIDDESARLARDGVAAAPAFARDPASRPDPAVLLGLAPDRVTRVLQAHGDGTGTVPLCAAEHRRVLSRDRHAARGVRFAPDVTRHGDGPPPADGHGPGTDDLVWTPAGRYAGVFRLLPVRTGSVRTVRLRGDDGATGPELSANANE